MAEETAYIYSEKDKLNSIFIQTPSCTNPIATGRTENLFSCSAKVIQISNLALS